MSLCRQTFQGVVSVIRPSSLRWRNRKTQTTVVWALQCLRVDAQRLLQRSFWSAWTKVQSCFDMSQVFSHSETKKVNANKYWWFPQQVHNDHLIIKQCSYRVWQIVFFLTIIQHLTGTVRAEAEVITELSFCQTWKLWNVDTKSCTKLCNCYYFYLEISC